MNQRNRCSNYYFYTERYIFMDDRMAWCEYFCIYFNALKDGVVHNIIFGY